MEVCWIGIVSGLIFIYVVVWVQVLIFIFLMIYQFQFDVGQYFVGIYVDGSVCVVLIDIYWELVYVFIVVKDFIICGNDGVCYIFRNGLQFFVGQCCCFFYYNYVMYKFRDVVDFVIVNVEVFNCFQSVNIIVGFSWNFSGI